MDRSIYDSDLDFWFNEVEAYMGERSTLQSTLSALDRGNASAGTYEEPFGHFKLYEWHAKHDRIRQCQTRLLKLSKDEYRLLEVHYTAKTGAGDARDIDKYDHHKQRCVNPVTCPKCRCEFVQHLRARFGEYSAVLVYLAQQTKVGLLGIKKVADIDDLAEKAEKQLKAAHRSWRATNPKAKRVNLDASFLQEALPVAV